MTPADAAPGATRLRTIALLLATVLPLYVVFALAKFIEMKPGWVPRFYAMLSYPIDVATFSFSDLVYVLVIAMLFYFPLRWTIRQRGIHRGIWIALLAFMLANVIYAVINIKLHEFLGTPLTLPLLRMAGDVKSMRESTGTFVTARSVSMLIIAPFLYLLMVRKAALSRWFESRRVLWSLVAIFIAYSAFESYAYARRVRATVHESFARNIVYHFIASCSTRLSGGESSALSKSVPAEYFDDFKLFSERGQPAQTYNGFRPKNVIIVTLESVNAMYMSVYGSEFKTTPNLEENAKHSLIFDNAYAHAGYTAHSMISLVMSMYSGMGWKIYVEDYPDLRGTSMAKILKERGYRTAFMTSQDLEFQNMRRFLTYRSFDQLKDFSELGKGLRMTGWGGDDRELVTGLLKWIDENPTQPFYALTWTQQTHHPYQLADGQTAVNFLADTSTQRTNEKNRYLSALHATDEQIQRLLDGLKERHLEDDTLVIITGDHGEAFGSPHKWYSHGTALYEENIRVPMIFINPKMFPTGTRSSVIGGHIDLNPTICDMLGIAPAPAWQGSSLLDPAHPSRAYFATVAASYLMGIREGNWKFIYNATFATEELYDLKSDPTEQINVAKDHPDVCKTFRDRISAWVQFEKQHMQGLLGQAK